MKWAENRSKQKAVDNIIIPLALFLAEIFRWRNAADAFLPQSAVGETSYSNADNRLIISGARVGGRLRC